MLMPSRSKYRKVRKGKVHGGVATSLNELAYGAFGLVSMESDRISSRQIEAGRQAMTRYIKRGGQIWIRIFPHTPVTNKPLDMKMGSGKGNPEFFVAKVKPGTIMFEMDGVTEDQAREAMRLAGHKLPIKTSFIAKKSREEEAS
jgi:large subunit ribosomal protein L16